MRLVPNIIGPNRAPGRMLMRNQNRITGRPVYANPNHSLFFFFFFFPLCFNHTISISLEFPRFTRCFLPPPQYSHFPFSFRLLPLPTLPLDNLL